MGSGQSTLRSDLRARLDSLIKQAEKEPEDLKTLRDEAMEELRKEARGVTKRGLRATTKRRYEKAPRAPRRPREESFRLLDELIDEARAGAPDEWLATTAAVPFYIVREWRSARKIKRPRGHTRNKQLQLYDAMRLFGRPPRSPLQNFSGVGGKWEPPKYVPRQELNYSELCRHLHFLFIEMGSGIDVLASAFGFREKDVALAIAVEEAHLERVGTPCRGEGCDAVIDPEYGKYCTRCRGDRR